MPPSTSDIRRRANRSAEGVLSAYWGLDVPVDPVAIASSMGVRVVEAKLPRTVSGAFVWNPNTEPVIILQESDSMNRRRFTCAHELGHYVDRLESGTIGVEPEVIIDYRDPLSSSGTDAAERFANQFAAALLMPESAVRRLYRDASSVVELAKKFSVSPDAMAHRVTNLGLLQRRDLAIQERLLK